MNFPKSMKNLKLKVEVKDKHQNPNKLRPIREDDEPELDEPVEENPKKESKLTFKSHDAEIAGSVGINQTCNYNYILFTRLSWSGDSAQTLRSSSQAATCLRVYHTRWRLHAVRLMLNVELGSCEYQFL